MRKANEQNSPYTLVENKKINDILQPSSLYCTTLTEKSYQQQLNYFFQELGDYSILQLNNAIESFILQESASLATKRIRKYALLKYFKTVTKDPLQKTMIVEFINNLSLEKKITLALNEEQALTVDQVKLIKSLPLTLKQRACFLALVETGLRASELLNIKLSDIQPSIHSDKVSVVKVLGKGNKERSIYMNNEIINLIKTAFNSTRYLFEGPPKHGQVSPLGYRSLYAQIKAIGKKIGLPKTLHPHMLRHTFATHALNHGKKSIKAISTYLGHASTAITQDVYIHSSLNAKDFEVF